MRTVDVLVLFQADGSLLKNVTTPDGYKVNEEGIWKQAVAAVNSDAVKPEQKQKLIPHC